MMIFIQYCKSIIIALRKCLIRYKIIILMPKVTTYFAHLIQMNTNAKECYI